jgi:UDP-N-acetylmuramate--alanine ligase
MSRRVHIVGIGGTGLSGIARVLHERGERVSGSDQTPSEYSRALEGLGVPVAYGHRAENVAGADVVLASSAIAEGNPELAAARRAGIPVLRRETFLAELTAGFETLAVAGTHGKSTTTGMIAWILDRAGKDPSFIVGGMLADFGTNAHAGGGKAFVIEADEYDRAFLGLRPSVAVVTSVEHDHPDCYPTAADFQAAFEAFVDRVQDLLLVCQDNPGAASLGRDGLQRLTYGMSSQADWTAEETRLNAAGGSDFLAVRRGEVLGLVRTRLPGAHNVLNSLAALAACDHLGVPLAIARDALTEFHGVGRRFEVMGQVGGITVIDDYGHHPTEIRATLAAARQRYPQAEIWAVFQPHTFSRTRALLEGFAAAFGDADHVVVTEVFAAREKPDGVTSGAQIVGRMSHPDARFISELDEAAETVLHGLRPGSVVVILSAGDANRIGRLLLERLKGGSEGGSNE